MDLVRNLVIASGIVAVILAIIHVFVIDSSNLERYKKPFTISLYQRAASDKAVLHYTRSIDDENLRKSNAEFAMPGERLAPLV